MSAQDNKRIIKNTSFLYLRMLFTMGVTLYTSRVVMRVLGVEDFGIYNVVGGVIMIFSFINSSMTSATQRFITFELGTGNSVRLNKVFSSSIQIHAFIAIIILLLGETIGLWFLNEKLVIPENRIHAAQIVYQSSILISCLSIMTVPFNANIIAHEQMSAFAYISIAEVILKLIIVFLLELFSFDYLSFYAILFALVQFLVFIMYYLYCKFCFKDTKYNNCVAIDVIKEMSGFAGWSMFGNMSSVLFSQGLNMMLNMFFGPVVNAARGVAVQVQAAIQQFVGSFQMAINPQITKNCAIRDYLTMYSLIFRSAKFSCFLLLLLAFPVVLETSYILRLWLVTVPDNSIIFLRIMLLISLLFTMSNPCMIANQATGDVKMYQILVGSCQLMILPISYVFLINGFPAYIVFVIHFCVEIIAQMIRLLLLHKQIGLSVFAFFVKVYIPVIKVSLLSLIFPILAHQYLDEGFMRFMLVLVVSSFSILLACYYVGLDNEERCLIKTVSKKIHHLFK